MTDDKAAADAPASTSACGDDCPHRPDDDYDRQHALLMTELVARMVVGSLQGGQRVGPEDVTGFAMLAQVVLGATGWIPATKAKIQSDIESHKKMHESAVGMAMGLEQLRQGALARAGIKTEEKH